MPALRRQQQGRGAGNDTSMCCNCFVTGQMPVCNAGDEAKGSSKVPTKSGHGFSIAKCQQRHLERGRFSLVSKVASVGTDNKLNKEVTRAALRPHQVAAAAGDGPAAGTETLGQ
jgi:hypothetical protein